MYQVLNAKGEVVKTLDSKQEAWKMANEIGGSVINTPVKGAKKVELEDEPDTTEPEAPKKGKKK